MSVQVGAHYLEKMQGGAGVLLGGVPGVARGQGRGPRRRRLRHQRRRMAMGMEAQVYVIDKNLERLYELDLQFGPMLNTIFSTVDAIEQHVRTADLVDRRRAGPRRRRAQARHARDGRADAARARSSSTSPSTRAAAARPRGPTTPCRADLRRGRRRPLLRDQHAGRGAAHLDLRAQQRDAALRRWRSPTRATARRSRTTRISPPASTSSTGGSPTRRWREI